MLGKILRWVSNRGWFLIIGLPIVLQVVFGGSVPYPGWWSVIGHQLDFWATWLCWSN